MIFAKLGQFVSCDTVGEIESLQAELVLYLQSVCLSLPLQPVDMEQLVRPNTIIYSSSLTKGGEIRKSSILEIKVLLKKEEFIHLFTDLVSSFRVPDDLTQDMEKFVCALYGNQWLSSVNEMCYKMFVQNFDNKKIIYFSLLTPSQTWNVI